MSKQTDFIEKYAQHCVEACSGTPLFPSVKIAQMALETGWGRAIKTAGHNCFGIKAGKSWIGKVVSNTTREVLDGASQVFPGTGKIYANRDEAIKDKAHYQTLFRAYDSEADSIRDHNRLLLTSKTYERVRAAKSADEQCDMLLACGYATAPNYASVLKSLIKQYGLSKYDINY